MKRTQRKDALRNIRKQIVSYLSIFVIALLGVTSFLGLDYASDSIRHSGSDMYNSRNFRDMEVISTLLLSPGDVEAIRGLDGVADAEPFWQAGANVFVGGTSLRMDVQSLTERTNLPEVREGRLPARIGECAIEAMTAERTGWKVGDTVQRIATVDAAGDYFLGGDTPFTIVGIVNHPARLHRNVPDTPFLIVTKDAFDREAMDDCCMRVNVLVRHGADTNRFSNAVRKENNAVKTEVEALAAERTVLRDASVNGEIQRRIDEADDALREGETKLNDARKELDDGWSQLRDGEQKVVDGEAELNDAEQQLRDAEQKLADGEAELNDARKELDDAKQKLTDGEAELADARKQLDDAKQQLADGEAELADGRKQLDDAKAQLDEAENELAEGKRELERGYDKLESGWEQLEDAKAQVRDGFRSALEDVVGDTSEYITWASPNHNPPIGSYGTATELWITTDFKIDLSRSLSYYARELVLSDVIPDRVVLFVYRAAKGEETDPETARAYVSDEVASMVASYASGYEALSDGCNRWDAGNGDYRQGVSDYNDGLAKYEDGLAQYEAGEEQYAAALAEYEDGLDKYLDGERQYEDALAEYEDGKQQYLDGEERYAEGVEEYENGLAEYEQGKADYEQGLIDLENGRKELEDNRKKLEDGEAEYADGEREYRDAVQQRNEAVDAIEWPNPCRWIVLDLGGNAGSTQVRLSSQSLSNIELTFSMLFVVVGALVIYATLGKMIDEQRPLVGVTKALGFFNREILAKYLLFGVSATLAGTVAGILLARFWIAPFALNGYGIFFTIDLTHVTPSLWTTLGTLVVGALLAATATVTACLRLVRTPAIRLLQQKVPEGRHKTAKQGKHVLSLYMRLILKNIRSDLKRVLVTVVSIAGCCALIVVGVTLKSAVEGTTARQYSEVIDYDGRVRCEQPDEMEKVLKATGVEYVKLCDETVSYRVTDLQAAELYCGDIEKIGGMFRLTDIGTKTPFASADDGVLISRRISEAFGLSVGDVFELTSGGTRTANARVAGIFENFIGSQMATSPACYAAMFGGEPEMQAFFVRFGDADPEAALAAIRQAPGFEDYTPSEEGRGIFLAATSVVNIVVLLFIFMAAVMAGVVQMNLTNIYINQKKRELTIMRINGFTVREVIGYVLRETAATTLIGILLGAALGSGLAYSIVRSLEQTFYQLDRSVSFAAWGFGAALTVLFTVVVNAIVLRKVKKLKLTDMA